MKTRRGRGCLTGALLGVIALCGLAVFLVWRARTPPIGEDFARLPLPEKQRRRAAARQLETQVQDLAKAARRKERKHFALAVSEQQLNTLLQDRLNTTKFPIREPRAGLSPGHLSLQGRVNYQGIDAVATLTGNIVVQDGELTYQAESLEVGGFPISSLRDKAQRGITRALRKWQKDAPGRIERVTIADKQMTIEGVTH